MTASAVAPPTALVTGAAGDIGRAASVALARQGWALALCDHPDAARGLQTTADAVIAAGAPAWMATFDVRDATAAADAVARCVAEAGSPRALFNNAGVQGVFAPIDRYPLDDAALTIMVNVVGVFNVLATVGAAMVDAGSGGAIVCTASMAGVSGAPNMTAYSASKAAIVGLVRSAAKDLAPHAIRVNAVSPAFIGPGRMWDRQVAQQAGAASRYYSTEPAEVAAQMLGAVPLGRLGSPGEVASAVAYLLSDDASYVTGVNLEVAGGV